MKFIKSSIQNFEAWLFVDMDLRRLALFRVIICLSLLSMYIPRQWHLKDFYDPQGMAPTAQALGLYPEAYRPFFSWFFWPEQLYSWAHLALIISLICVLLGVGGRALLWLAWILDIAFIQRNYSVIFGADLIASIWLFYLAFTQCSKSLSLQNYFLKKEGPVKTDLLNNMAFRLMQIQICIIYMYTGFEKLKGQSWWDGTALWTVLGNPQMVVTDFSFIRNFPLLIGVLTFSTILLEVYWPILVWSKKYKNYILLAGLFFHTGIAVSMQLYQFSAVMVGTYLFFVDKEFIDRVLSFLKLRKSSTL